jgi:cysteine-S-conjugate beta-lyase
MSQNNGLDRRAFLKSAGMSAVAGAVASGTATLTAAGGPAFDTTNGKYDFDTVYNRIGTDCVKWDQQIRTYSKDSIAVGMGIADMDFRAAPVITKALMQRIQHENWGYLDIPHSYVESILDWNKRRYGVEINPDLLLHSTGVHPGIISALRAFSPPGTKVLLQTPTYNGFYGDISAVGCKPEESPLKLVNGRYSMDFEDLERRINHETNTLILCNPQNPTGNCWTREDLTTLGEICTRRRVVVLADEIHHDFVTKGNKYTPYSTLGNEAIVRNSISFTSASKSFSLAAAKCAYMFSTNPDYIARVKAAGHKQDINTLGMVACRAAYNEGTDWLDQVVAYIDGNHEFVESYVRANLPMVKVVKPQGTYLSWLDVSQVLDKIGAQQLAAEANKSNGTGKMTPTGVLERHFVKHAKVHMNAGASYGLGGEARMRMNIATSRKLVELALTNIAGALKKA